MAHRRPIALFVGTTTRFPLPTQKWKAISATIQTELKRGQFGKIGDYFFDVEGDWKSGRLAWSHIQEGNAASRYAVYFDVLPAGTVPQRSVTARLSGRRRYADAGDWPYLHGRNRNSH